MTKPKQAIQPKLYHSLSCLSSYVIVNCKQRLVKASDNFCRTKSANADVVKDEGEKVWQRIEDAEEAKLDEELAMAKSRNTSQDGEPDENIHGEPERLNESDTDVELEDSKLLFSRIGGQ